MKRKTDNFSKFYNKKNNAAIKEGFKQEKKAAKKERKEAIERHFEARRKAKAHPGAPANSQTFRPQTSRPTTGKGPATPKGPAQAQNPTTASTGSPAPTSDHLPLNKYIAHSGICSRR